MTAPAPAVVLDCPPCAGRGVVIAQPVPSGAQRAAGHPQPSPRQTRCPACHGRGAHILKETP